MNKVIMFAAVCGALIALPACKKKKIKNLKSDMTEGTWRVSSFNDDGNDETGDYAGDTFKFNSDGTLVVTGTHNATGSWSVRKEDSGDDDLFDDKHLEFVISLPIPLDDLSDDWEVESSSDSKLDLKDDSGGDDSEEHLTFVKN